MYKLITFDINETLIKSRLPIGEMYAQAGKIFGINGVESSTLDFSFRNQWINMCKLHPNFGLHSGLGWETWWKNIVRDTFLNSTNEKINEKTLNRVASYLDKLFSTKEGWKYEDATVEILKRLKSNKIPLGVISNFDPRLSKILMELNLDNYFDFILSSYECSYSKPDVNIFKAAQRLYEQQNGVKLETSLALHVGNSLEIDGKGAIDAGWNAAIITNVHTEKEHNKIMYFRNLIDFNRYIMKYNR